MTKFLTWLENQLTEHRQYRLALKRCPNCENMMDIIKDANHKVDLLMHKVEHHQPVVEDNVNTNTKPVTYQSARVSRAKAMRDSFEQIKKLEKEFEEAQNARSSISFSSEA